MDQDLPLIVGAGPVGLAAALLLTEASPDGRPGPRIIDSQRSSRQLSKALAVNPRTLRILGPSGVAARMLELGKPITTAMVHARGRVVARVDLAQAGGEHPFMLALSQATSERLLGEALAERGVAVERGVTLAKCRVAGERAAAELHHPDGRLEQVTAPWILAADGAHSTVREQLGIALPGTTCEQRWRLVDVRIETPLAEDAAHIVQLPRGFGFLIRVVTGDEPSDGQLPLWRIITNTADPCGAIRDAGLLRHYERPDWASEFKVSHRAAASMQHGPFLLAGDAAHLHSPLGARGMNLGIEDAWALAELAAKGQLNRYGALRTPVDHRVVKKIDRITHIVRGESAATRAARRVMVALLAHVPAVQRAMVRTVMGLDHVLGV
ncbi:Pentachlorophenol 4-monooxygenase [Posidoniimonas polymericola]|uniref:Pentachlorophenol 4-monooxygenase n=1 Tax=Posidoniimonas polymericola TaxID=2528002 RepID=A0A5C5YT64_9BACT|nr:NAD(P)/FAD-dependent oxidoreductase [Posidoniimonas polymericola]TWT77970.1 Pentachlorophenol 4-monooxygenase [Posidoniimonas polymericola]